jgi:hypothetical protein
MSMIQLHHVVKRGASAGAVLTPHRGRDGKLIVSTTDSQADHVRIDSEAEALRYLMKGYKLRMSDPKRRSSPSLISFKMAA